MNRSREAAKSATVSPDDAVERARALVPALRERQESVERAGSVSADSIREIAATGLFRLMRPAVRGGWDHGIDSLARATAAIASGCGATGWSFAGRALAEWLVANFPPPAPDDVWKTTPDAGVGGSFDLDGAAAQVDGGWRVTGRWASYGALEHCEWVVLGVQIGDGKNAPAGFALVPVSDVRNADGRSSVGLAAVSGSAVVLDSAFVPAHRVTSGMASPVAETYRRITSAAAILGMAQGALDDYLEGIRTRMTRGAAVGAAKGVADFQSIQLRVGEASSSLNAAQSLIQRDARQIAAGPEKLAANGVARIRANTGFAVRLSLRAADLLFESVGGMGIYNRSRVQRFWRDAHAAAQLMGGGWDATAAAYGRTRIGRAAGS